MCRLDFLHYICYDSWYIHMSRIQKNPPPTMIEPEIFEEEQETIVYEPQHPALAFHAELKSKIEPDHLENYVEVTPFE